jgi:hypothetical protein
MATQSVQLLLSRVGIVVRIIVVVTAAVVLHRAHGSTAIGWGLLRRGRSHCSRQMMSSIITAAASAATAAAAARLTSLVGGLLIAHHGSGRW